MFVAPPRRSFIRDAGRVVSRREWSAVDEVLQRCTAGRSYFWPGRGQLSTPHVKRALRELGDDDRFALLRHLRAALNAPPTCEPASDPSPLTVELKPRAGPPEPGSVLVAHPLATL